MPPEKTPQRIHFPEDHENKLDLVMESVILFALALPQLPGMVVDALKEYIQKNKAQK